MLDMMNNLMPNVMADLPRLYQSIIQTFVMLFYSGIISFFIGGFLGILLIVTKKFGIMENILVYEVLSKVINFFRAIPFIILLAMLVPLTRFIMGTAIGVKGAIIPLIFGTVPFFARQIESALSEVNPGLVEAAQSMGSSPIAIIFRVYLKESIAENCYFLENIVNESNGNIIIEGTTPTTSEELKKLHSILGTSFKEDTNNINNGYPIFQWQ